MTTKLHALIGSECKLEATSTALREFIEELRPAVVGAHHVTCSDETERECAETFHRWFAGRMLPELKPANRAAFRTANLGARYEWGAIRIAEEHFTQPSPPPGLKVVLLKLNSHAAVRDAPQGPEYGWLDRYGCESACCGTLASLLEGSELAAVRELARLFDLDGRDRVRVILDSNRVPVPQRALLAAVVNARLQARRAVADIEEHRPHGPTIFLVLPCVTLNRPGPDTELVVGQYGIDWTGKSPETKYRGLSEDPAQYRVSHQQRALVIADDHWPGS